jgi:hypothetical protein
MSSCFFTISPTPEHVLTIKVAGISFLIHADKLNAHDKMEFAYVHFADGSISTGHSVKLKLEGFDDVVDTNLTFSAN